MDDAYQENAYLILDSEIIYEVAPNSVLNIGRLDTNDIILDDYKVSREHAVLKFSRDEFMLVDLASTQGTYVNGERVDRTIVNFDDKIQIVGHELVLQRAIPAATGDTRAIPALRSARSIDRHLKFFGGLNEFALITLVQFLHQEKQSGLLLLEVGQKPGPRLYFYEGEIIHVSEGENLAELMTRQVHEQSLFFYFHHETIFPRRTIQESTPNYLMGLCHSHDEKKVAMTVAMRSTSQLSVTTRIEVPPPSR